MRDYVLITANGRRQLIACPHEAGWAVRLIIDETDEKTGELKSATAVVLSADDWKKLKETVDGD